MIREHFRSFVSDILTSVLSLELVYNDLSFLQLDTYGHGGNSHRAINDDVQQSTYELRISQTLLLVAKTSVCSAVKRPSCKLFSFAIAFSSASLFTVPLRCTKYLQPCGKREATFSSGTQRGRFEVHRSFLGNDLTRKPLKGDFRLSFNACWYWVLFLAEFPFGRVYSSSDGVWRARRKRRPGSSTLKLFAACRV